MTQSCSESSGSLHRSVAHSDCVL